MHKLIPSIITMLIISPYVSLSYGIWPLNYSLILILIFSEKSLGTPKINFSFQKDCLQSDFSMTLVRNMSLYHLKPWNLGHLRLVKRSTILFLIFAGSRMKCFDMENIRVATASSISCPHLSNRLLGYHSYNQVWDSYPTILLAIL